MRVLNTNAITALSQDGRNQSVLSIVHHTLNEYVKISIEIYNESYLSIIKFHSDLVHIDSFLN